MANAHARVTIHMTASLDGFVLHRIIILMWLASAFVAHPVLALVPAAVFGLLARRTHRRSAWLAAVAWLIYAVYETAMAHRILCSGDCDIRVDLLLIYPVLGVLSLLAVLIMLWPWWARRLTRHDRSRTGR